MESIHHRYVYDFIHSGRASFTVYNHRTGNHLAVLIRKAIYSQHTYKVYSQGTELGTIKDDVFTPVPDNDNAKRFLWFYRQVVARSIAEEIHVMHHNRCGYCGRKLTDPLSIACGLGPECRKRLNITIKPTSP